MAVNPSAPAPATATPRTGSLPGVEQSVDASKQALLSAIAQQGQTGQAAFTAEAGRQQAAHAAALAGIAAQGAGGPMRGFGAPAALTAQLQGQQTGLQNIYDMDRALSQQTYNNAFGTIRAGNAAYMDQARAAVPALRAQTDGLVAQERARLEAERLQMEQARLDAIAAEEERQFQREQMAYEREIMEAERAARGGYSQEEVDRYAAGLKKRQGEVFSDAFADGAWMSTTDDYGNKFDPITGEPIKVDVASVLDEITTVAPDLERALAIANAGYEEGDHIEGYNRLVDYLVQHYTGQGAAYRGDGATLKLASRLESLGIDPARVLPGYVPEGERGRQGGTGAGRGMSPEDIRDIVLQRLGQGDGETRLLGPDEQYQAPEGADSFQLTESDGLNSPRDRGPYHRSTAIRRLFGLTNPQMRRFTINTSDLLPPEERYPFTGEGRTYRSDILSPDEEYPFTGSGRTYRPRRRGN